jgi:Zn-dependent M28 family amino/carboxypeptidase
MDQFLRSIISELTVRFPSRNAYNPAALLGAAEFLAAELHAHDLEVESAPYFDGTSTVRNLVVHKSGSDPTAGVIVVGAHYDTVLGTPGADDNASGVAGVVELARRFAHIPTRHPLSFVLFPHEEPPFFYTSTMGSRQYAASLARANVGVELMMSLEMIGYSTPGVSQRYPFPLMRILGSYPREADFIAIVGNLRSMGKVRRLGRAMREGSLVRVASLAAPGFLPPLFLSDHSSFWKYGFPAVMITDTAFLRNPHYHAPSDTIATLDFEFLLHVVDGVEAGIRSLDAER